MSRSKQDLKSSLAGYDHQDWVAAIRDRAAEHGDFTSLGPQHMAAYVKRSSTLLVTFETLQGIRALSPRAHPLGWHMVSTRNWSHLMIASDGDTWFRNRALFGYFDKLTDKGFFDSFNNVLFYGAGPCGYAAAAFSVAAPGARVLVVQPQATLDPRIAGWDDRFIHMRSTNFNGRYGYAPDMLDAADQGFVLYDPNEPLDAMHAALFTRPNIQKFRLRFMGDAIQTDLLEMDILDPLLDALADETLDPLSFAALMRARRSHIPYLRNLMAALENQDRLGLLRRMVENVTSRLHAPRFARRLAQFEEQDSLVG